jgi:hypothetical protein
MGASLLRIKAQPTGIKTRQMAYFSPIANKLYFTCMDLGLIPRAHAPPQEMPGDQCGKPPTTMRTYRPDLQLYMPCRPDLQPRGPADQCSEEPSTFNN